MKIQKDDGREGGEGGVWGEGSGCGRWMVMEGFKVYMYRCMLSWVSS